MITDKIHIRTKSGDGGNGAVYFGTDKKPNGGDGGRGGDVILQGTTNLYDFAKVKYGKEYKAENADKGGAKKMRGLNGKDMIIQVPITTIIFDSTDNHEIGRITEHGQRIVLSEGGKGGLGNFNFRRGQIKTLRKHTPGRKGIKHDLILELNLFADIVFIGFPNAGKSSLLNAMTNATSRVAAYPFTTLKPHLGVAGNMILMDLPGLIEGTTEGKGLGTRFTRHTKYAKLVAHFVGLDNEDPLDAYKRMRIELEKIDIELAEKNEVILLTKSDLITPEELVDIEKKFAKLDIPVISLSTFVQEDIEETTKFFRDHITD